MQPPATKTMERAGKIQLDPYKENNVSHVLWQYQHVVYNITQLQVMNIW